MRWNVTNLAVVLGVAVALAAGTASAQQIATTKHDLSGDTTATDEVCVFCHTPHASSRDASTGDAPLWNKPGGTATFTAYDSATLQGPVLAVGSVSLACLSCHDGSQAVDTVINAPGSDGFTAGGAELDLSALTTLPLVGGNSIAAVGADDMQNDHPIGIRYGGFSGTGVTALSDFLTTELATNGLTLGDQRWWVDTTGGTGGTREKTDMILYTRDNTGTFEPFVECASCHDPHNDANGRFMRVSNSSSGVCLSCHVK